MSTVQHLAIIMDGNGRWATQRNQLRAKGHLVGAQVTFDIIRHAANIGIPTISLFAFSKDNWQRPPNEVNMLMQLMAKSLREKSDFFREFEIKLRIIGDREEIPTSVKKEIENSECETANNSGMEAMIALNYSGQFDILQAVRRLSNEKADLSDVTETDLQKALLTGTTKNPDLIVRTGGETRLSNFFLWQAACSEIHFEEKLWPDFSCHDLDRHLEQFARTERRFGKTSAQLKHG
ncbi:MAG: di-trans,poly-cis-decaprenylcistransferase [Deltaproteobacteria bacterium]|nr:di-trans,poly-cis-decaprenylcistransferase [Deltaproteobacteria bacterium]